jgi:hypothetical protein
MDKEENGWPKQERWEVKAREKGGQGKEDGRPRQGRWVAKGEGDGRLSEAGKFAADFVEFD